MISSIIRILRFVFMVLSLLLPSLYVAVLTYHQEMVPTALLIKRGIFHGKVFLSSTC